MTAYRDPDFQERAALSRAAKQKALDLLRAKPRPSETELAERKAAAAAREAAEAELRLARATEKQAAFEARAQAAADDRAVTAEAMIAPPKSDTDRKAERDARYAARKARK